MNIFKKEYKETNITKDIYLSLDALRGGGVGTWSLTDYQKLWYNCSLFVNTSFDTN